MFNDSFMIEPILRQAFIIFKKNFAVFILLAIILFIVNAFSFFIKFLPLNINIIIQFILNAYVLLSFTRAALLAIRGQKININEMLKNDRTSVIRFIFVILIFSIGTLLGAYSTIFVFFTIIIAAIFIPLPFIVVNENLSLSESVKICIQMTTSNFASLLLFVLISFLICIAGLIAFVIGELIALPVVIIASALIYEKLR
ncbi:MAG: hypothetical protein LBQ37_03680 [Elusimicrobiota bacterium]|jgi:hypothetical protein|nr:hypothetical protein [Elusimicrobiota bacterium]